MLSASDWQERPPRHLRGTDRTQDRPGRRVAKDCPTRRSGLANLRRGNRRLRSRERRPSTLGPPTRHRDPTRHRNGLAPNAAAPTGRSICEGGRLFSRRREPLGARPNRRHPKPARYLAPARHSLAPYSSAGRWRAQRSRRFPRVERRTLGRDAHFGSPCHAVGFCVRAITACRRPFIHGARNSDAIG